MRYTIKITYRDKFITYRQAPGFVHYDSVAIVEKKSYDKYAVCLYLTHCKFQNHFVYAGCYVMTVAIYLVQLTTYESRLVCDECGNTFSTLGNMYVQAGI